MLVHLSLAGYDRCAGFLIDSNVWMDCIDTESPWHDRAIDQLQRCSELACPAGFHDVGGAPVMEDFHHINFWILRRIDSARRIAARMTLGC